MAGQGELPPPVVQALLSVGLAISKLCFAPFLYLVDAYCISYLRFVVAGLFRLLSIIMCCLLTGIA